LKRISSPSELADFWADAVKDEVSPVPYNPPSIVYPDLRHYTNVSVSALLKRMGCPVGRGIPGLAEHIDLGGLSRDSYTTWSKAGREWLASRGQKFSPWHHQLAGILMMMHLAFQGLPVVLLDDVGVGKTLQLVGFIALVTYFRMYYEKYEKFPGEFGKRSFMIVPCFK
jgi:hypothetical protein